MSQNVFQLRSLGDYLPVAPEPRVFKSEIWTIEDVATYARMSKGGTYGLVNRPGFPSPLGNSHRNRRWLARDVKAYFENVSKQPNQSKSYLPVDFSFEPSTIVFSNKENK
jgi:predicted DNA-binding transcriptional regulator AlpA